MGSQEKVKCMRFALKNNAIDAKLAEETFHTIVASNRALYPDTISLFRYLKLCARSWWSGGFPDTFASILDWVCASWECEREQLDAYSRGVSVRELGATRKINALHYLTEYIEENFEYCEDKKLYRVAWDSV